MSLPRIPMPGVLRDNELTKPFVDAYVKRFGETPTYTSDTYAAIMYGLVPTIEQAGTLDPDKIVSILENRVYKVPAGTVKYMKDAEGKPLHDLTWGPGYPDRHCYSMAGW